MIGYVVRLSCMGICVIRGLSDLILNIDCLVCIPFSFRTKKMGNKIAQMSIN